MATSRKTNFQKNLESAEDHGDEDQIKGYWISEIKKVKPKAKIAVDCHTDAILTVDSIHALMEFKNKKGLLLKTKQIKCAALMQAIFYLKTLNKKGQYPSTIFIADGSDCFFLRTDVLNDYINRDKKIFGMDGEEQFNWDIPASQAYIHHPKILTKMVADTNLDHTYNFNVKDNTFRVRDIIPILDSISKNYDHRVTIDEDNLIPAFQYFKSNVMSGYKTPLIITPVELDEMGSLIDIFYNFITDRNTTGQIHEGKIISRSHSFTVNQKQFEQFFNLFKRDNYRSSEMVKLVAIKDRVMEEMTRRMTGAFFTPDLWIAKAHEMIAEQFGDDWKEKYVVWDCASGTNNLTHKQFNPRHNNLYSSTLLKGDIDNVNDVGHPGKTFQYNFLNEDSESLKNKCPNLHEALVMKKPILFLINPPYGTSSGMIGGQGKSKAKISTETLVNIVMKKNNMGACSEQLYAQFLYRILMLKNEYRLTDIKICVFSAPLFMSGESYKKFRDVFYSNFIFKDGILFPADKFANVSGHWGISFTIWGENR